MTQTEKGVGLPNINLNLLIIYGGQNHPLWYWLSAELAYFNALFSFIILFIRKQKIWY